MTPRNTALNRRLLLQGMGAAVALPWLESGHLLGTEKEVTPPRRFGCLFWGDGIHPAEWWSKGDGAEMELGPAFESLEEVKQKVSLLRRAQPSHLRVRHTPLDDADPEKVENGGGSVHPASSLKRRECAELRRSSGVRGCRMIGITSLPILGHSLFFRSAILTLGHRL